MQKITFYPLGNADCCLISIEGGQLILFDYADMCDQNDDNDLRVDLSEKLLNELETAGKKQFDVVAFTHADKDHINGFSDFFYLDHAQKYQSDDRIKIRELWVPAAVILESHAKDEHQILRAEARYRFKQGKGIRVFSKPDLLEEWLEENGLTLGDRKDFITSAGQLIPSFSKSDGIEFFVHSPFSESVDEQIIRNDAALVVQATFRSQDRETKLIMGADIAHPVWSNIVNITKYYSREERLAWDVFKISHHCSYLSLSDDKGNVKTDPVSEVKWLFEQGNEAGIIVSTSNPIPEGDENTQPPQRQAANYYNKVADEIKGEFKVTMQHPSKTTPKPLVIEIDEFGATIKKLGLGAVSVLTDRRPPRAG